MKICASTGEECTRDGWISVLDELPDKDMAVVVYMSDRDSIIVTNYIGGNFAVICPDWNDKSKTYCPVTHWMPLPPRPKDQS